MKKIILSTVIFMFCLLFPACGTKNAQEEPWRGIAPGMEDLSAVTDRTEYYDLAVESEPLFGQEPGVASTTVRTGYRHLGTQFIMGEPVQLMAAVSLNEADIYLRRKDGDSELVLQDVPNSLVSSFPAGQWYLDREGSFYCIRKSFYTSSGEGSNSYTRQDAFIAKLLPSGEILYETPLPADTDIEDICQPEDGNVYVLLRNELENTRILAQIDPDSGKLLADSRLEVDYTSQVYLGSAGASPAVTGYSQNLSREMMKANPADGSLSPILYFTGTSYGWHSESELQDFRTLEDGSIELLWADLNGPGSFLERLRMEKVKKIPIVCRGLFRNDSWFGERVAWFNRESENYHVVLEDCGSGNDAEDFARLTSVQIGAGKGPDILYGYFLEDYIDGMLKKGALEKLNPYLETSGIREEDYFPLTFNTFRQGDEIYGITYRFGATGYVMAEDVLGSQNIPAIDTLADALLAWDGDGVWQEGFGPGDVLNAFLEGSESLWGMVNWETGSCDFNTPLFGKLLEAAMRYGDNGRKSIEYSICEREPLLNLVLFKGRAEREAEGVVPCGTLFDDGCRHAYRPGYTMAVNAGSSHKEGAWEFISFLIGEESQSANPDCYVQPVHRKVFETWLQETVIYELTTEHTVNGVPLKPAYYGADTSEEKQTEYRQAIETARPLPLRTRPILTIILEEAEDYFNGSKNGDEITKIINNRVQLYLDEGKQH